MLRSLPSSVFMVLDAGPVLPWQWEKSMDVSSQPFLFSRATTSFEGPSITLLQPWAVVSGRLLKCFQPEGS